MTCTLDWKKRIGAVIMPRLWIGLTGLLVATTPLAAAPTATIEDDTVVVRGLTPGAELAIMGAGRQLDDWVPVVLADRGHMTDDDGDGVARYTPPFPIPVQSVWAVVDLANGGMALAAPEGTSVREMEILSGRRSDTLLSWAGQRAEVLVVRPGVGAWMMSVGDGGETDADGRSDGMLGIQSNHLISLVESGAGVLGGLIDPPGVFAADDVMVMLEPSSLQIAAVRVNDMALQGHEEKR